MPAVVPAAPRVTPEHVAWTLDRLHERVGNPYVYGGQFDRDDADAGCDCSALVAFVCNGVLYGDAAPWRRVDGATGAWITTESWRPVEVGDTGPFGSITVAGPGDIPDDATVKIALHHGPGGGVASHMWCELQGERFECNGSYGFVTGDAALPIDSPYGNDWAYIAAGTPEPEPEPLAPMPEPDPAPAVIVSQPAHALPEPPARAPHHELLERIVLALGELAQLLDTPQTEETDATGPDVR